MEVVQWSRDRDGIRERKQKQRRSDEKQVGRNGEQFRL
jgi:hypothetical protein